MSRSLWLPQRGCICLARRVQEGDYGAAWAAAVAARVDLNCLVDFGWPALPAAAAAFLATVPAPADVADLLAALSPSDCTAPGAIYAGMAALPRPRPAAAAPAAAAEPAAEPVAEWVPDQPAGAAGVEPLQHGVDGGGGSAGGGAGVGGRVIEGKVAQVCGALRQAMQQAGAARYLKPILTSLAKVCTLVLACCLECSSCRETRRLPSAFCLLQHPHP